MEIDAIAAVSMQMSAAETANAVEIAMLRKALDAEQALAAQILQSLEAAIPAMPASYGHKLDISV